MCFTLWQQITLSWLMTWFIRTAWSLRIKNPVCQIRRRLEEVLTVRNTDLAFEVFADWFGQFSSFPSRPITACLRCEVDIHGIPTYVTCRIDPDYTASVRNRTILRICCIACYTYFTRLRWCQSVINSDVLCYARTTEERAHGGAVGWGTTLQAGRSRVQYPMVSLELFIILPAALRPWGWLSL
jgi:hypothetical protein